LLILYPFPVFIFYWLFESENPIERVSRDNFVLFSYSILAVGTLVYIIYWIGIIIHYPQSKEETWPSWYGSLKMFSVVEMWVSFLFCHAFGVFIALWMGISGVKRIFAKSS